MEILSQKEQSKECKDTFSSPNRFLVVSLPQKEQSKSFIYQSHVSCMRNTGTILDKARTPCAEYSYHIHTLKKESHGLIPTSTLFDQSVIAAQIDHDPLIQDSRAFFALLDWLVVEQWEAERSSRGRPAHPESAYLKAFLIRIREGMISTTQLRHFLLHHPLLVIELGFRLVLDPSQPYGFDAEQTLPGEYWFREKLRGFDPSVLQALLHSTVRAFQDEIPGLGDTVAIDVTHIYAWVRENNERDYVTDRSDKTCQPKGDPNCRLGVTRSTNQEHADGSSKERTPLGLWHRRRRFHRCRVWSRRARRIHPTVQHQ
jgi:hypothetical protein